MTDLLTLIREQRLDCVEVRVKPDGSGYFRVFGKSTAYLDDVFFSLDSDGKGLPTPEVAIARLAARLEKEAP